jgi:hypothetical protein
MQDIVDILARLTAGLQIPDVALEEGEVLPLFLGNQRAYVFQVVLIAGREIVQANYLVVLFEQGFQEIGAYKAGYAGY